MSVNLIDVVKIVTVVQICIVSIYLVFNSKTNTVRNYLITTFILSKAFYVADSVLIQYYQNLPESVIHFLGIGFTFQLILGPSLYFAVKSTIVKNLKLKPSYLIHLIPFFITLILLVSRFNILNYDLKIEILGSGFPYNIDILNSIINLFYFHFAVYGMLSIVFLYRIENKHKQNSSQPVEKNLFYFKFLIYDFLIVWGAGFINSKLAEPLIPWSILGVIIPFNIFFIANSMVYLGLKFPQLIETGFPKKQKYEKISLSDKEKKNYAKTLKMYMSDQKPYLNPELSLAELSEKIKIPAHIISQVLNIEIKQNFYDFVNNYRIEESKKLLVKNKEANKTVLQILYESGFNSKSSFNSAFKKSTGITPTEFKQKYLEDQVEVFV